MSNALASLVVVIALPLGFALLRRLFPYSSRPPMPAEEMQDLAQRAKRIDWAFVGLFFFFTGACALAWTVLLLEVSRLRDSMMPAHLLLVQLEPNWLIWACPGLFLGMISGGWLALLSLRLLLGPRRFQQYSMASSTQAGFDGLRAFKWMSIVFVTGAAVWSVLSLDWYDRFEEDRVVINELWGLGETTYGYDQVTQIVETTHFVAPNGKLVERTRQFVIFADGRQWCHDSVLRDPGPLLDLLTRKAGKPVIRARFLEDVVKP
jgi:hypothetical protein